MQSDRYSWWVRLASQALKYFLLTLFGFTLVCLLSMLLGAMNLATLLLAIMGQWLLRIAALIACLMALAIVVESLRN